MTPNSVVTVGQVRFGNALPLSLIAGPCQLESREHAFMMAGRLMEMCKRLKIGLVYKSSFDKANRQSSASFRGPGADNALKSLDKIKSKIGAPLLTDVHETIQVAGVAEVADVIQIPAFLSRQTDLLVETAKTGKVIHIKKGQFLAPWDMKAIAQKAVTAGNSNLLLCERGTTFGYNRLINDMTGLIEMRNLGFPVIMDCTHSTQLPGATGESSGGRGEMVWPLARAAMAVGVDGIFLETHPNPAAALCDGPTSLPLKDLEKMLTNLQSIWKTHFNS